VRVLCLTLAAFVLAAAHGATEEDTRSLAERAEAAAKSKKKPAPHDRVLTNEDLKKAKGNVIFLTATPAPVDAATAQGAAPGSAAAPADPSSVAAASISTVAIVDQRQKAARLRGLIEEAQRQLAVATPEQRPALEQRLNDALDELGRVHEAIGALTERVRAGTAVPPSH
jgi:hypothetical protein